MPEGSQQLNGEPAKLTLVVTCSSRKRASMGAGPRFRDLAGAPPSPGPLESWTQSLSRADATGTAQELYVGGQWSVIRRLASTPGVNLWVCSAGYGLFPGEARVAPYSVTFSPGHPDTVRDLGDWGWGSDASRHWWRELASWKGPAPGAPRTLSRLVDDGGAGQVLAVLSPPYLHVLKQDLLEVHRIAGEEALVVLSVGSRPDADLGKSLMKVDGSLVSVLGGVLGTAAVRAADHLVRELGPGDVKPSSASRVLNALLSAATPLRKYERSKGSDESVTNWIREQLKDGNATKGVLLRRFRDSGLACEQGRFGRLFELVQKERVRR